ncbi:MAG: hypothetical protein LLF76_14675 [Planctomycetaceae bacterium]|nr:hypothetical protein [Planctomycetaceae bacterium]
MRHIRQRIGDEAFRVLLQDHLQQQKGTTQPLDLTLGKGDGQWHRVTLQTIGGELSTQAAKRIAETAEAANAQIRIDLHHGLLLYSRKPLQLPQQLQEFVNRPRIVACPGNRTCRNGLVDCLQAAARLSAALKDDANLENKTIAISGCPNHCAHSPVADIGLAGRLKTIDGQRQEAFQVLLGGDNGRSAKLGEPMETVLAAELCCKVSEILVQFR